MHAHRLCRLALHPRRLRRRGPGQPPLHLDEADDDGRARGATSAPLPGPSPRGQPALRGGPVHAPGCGALSSVSSADLADLSSAAPWRVSGSPEITRDHARSREIARLREITSLPPPSLRCCTPRSTTSPPRLESTAATRSSAALRPSSSSSRGRTTSARDLAEIWPRYGRDRAEIRREI